MRFSCDLEYIDLTQFSRERFETILAYCPSKEVQYSEINKFAHDLSSKLSNSNCDYRLIEKCCVLLDLVLSYLDDNERYILVEQIANILLRYRRFELAEKYYDISLQNNSKYNHEARWGLLLCKLQCSGEQEFITCEQFHKDLPEYQQLLVACVKDQNAFSHYAYLVKRHELYIQEIEAVNAEKIKKEKEEKLRLEKEEKERIQREADKKRRYEEACVSLQLQLETEKRETKKIQKSNLMYWVLISLALILFIVAFITWLVLGRSTFYVIPVLPIFFVFSILFCILAITFAKTATKVKYSFEY